MNKSWRASLVLNVLLVDKAPIWIAVSCRILVGLGPNGANLVFRVPTRIFALVVEFWIQKVGDRRLDLLLEFLDMMRLRNENVGIFRCTFVVKSSFFNR